MSQVMTDLRGAKEMLKKHGWHRGDLRSHRGSLCLLGALYSTIIGYDKFGQLEVVEDDHRVRGGRAADRIADVLSSSPKFRGPIDIASWNDSPRRTVEDVYAVLDKAIALEGSKVLPVPVPVPVPVAAEVLEEVLV